MNLDDLTDILLPDNYHNNAGIYNAEYALPEWVESITVNDLSAVVTLKAGKSWKKIQSQKVGNQFLSEETQTVHGPVYETSYKGHHPGKSIQVHQQFDMLSRLPLLFRVEDNDGNIRLIGNLTEFAEFTQVSYETGGFPGSREGHTFEIKGQFTKPAYFL